MKNKHHIIVSRYNNSPIHIYVETEEEKNFVWNILHNALENREKYPDLISISGN